MSFNHIVKLAPSASKIAVFTLDIGAAEPVRLKVLTAAEANRKLRDAAIKGAGAYRHLLTGPNGITGKAVDEERKVAAKLYAKYVVVGWENVTDDQGALVAFTVERAEEFLLALVAAGYFEDLREFCKNASNFRDEEVPAASDLGPR